MTLETYNKKLMISIVIIAGLLLFTFAMSNIFKDSSLAVEGSSCGEDCPHEAQLAFVAELIPLLIGFGIMAGAGTFYIMSQKVVVKELVIKDKESILKKNTEILLRFFSKDERIVINRLIEGNGQVFQAEVTRIPGLGKVKTHRLIQRLIERGVLEKTDFGKTKMVRFTPEVKEGIL